MTTLNTLPLAAPRIATALAKSDTGIRGTAPDHACGFAQSLELRTILTLTRKELRDAMRSRWLIICAIAFAALSVGVSYLSRVGTSMAGFSGFGPTAASLVNLVLLIVPLISLTSGASSIASERERGTLAYILAQPVSRLEVFISKFAGLAIALLATLCLGFGACAIISPPGQLHIFLTLVAASAMLTIASLAIGLLISTITRKVSAATGAALLIWLTIVLLGDLGLMGSAVLFRLRASSLLLFGLINPAQSFKLLVISSFDNTLDVLGPSGLYAVNTFGHALPALLIACLAAWTVLPLLLAALIFTRRPL